MTTTTPTAATADDAADLRSDLAAIDAMPLSELISVDGGSVLGSALRRIREQSDRERTEISAFGSYIS